MSTGERLRRARLDAGKTLDQVAEETKIQLWILEALERDDVSRVPGGVFIRGYLRAFARAVHVDPTELLVAYPPEPAPLPAPPVLTPPPDPNERSGTPLWQYVVIVALVFVGAVTWRHMTRSGAVLATAASSPHRVDTPTPPPPPSAFVEPPVTAPAATTPLPAPAVPPNESGATATTGATSPNSPAEPHDADPAPTTPEVSTPLVVQLHANAEVWIEATTDGERKVYRLVEEGEDVQLEAQKEIRLVVGDAAAVSYTINGKPARPLGAAGVVREVEISPANIDSLTAPASQN